MAAEIQKRIKYNKGLGARFFLLCSEGNSLTKIAEVMGVDKQLLIDWSKDDRKFEWQNAWIRGKQAYQVFFEDKMAEMIYINPKIYDAASKAALMKFMERMFDDWKEKPSESKVEVTQVQLPTEQLKEEINKLLNKSHMKRELDLSLFAEADETGNNHDQLN